MIRAIGLFFLLLFQILGWTALILLTVMLLTFLLVLFVPIRYRVQVHNERCTDSLKHHPAENLQVHLQVHWLLHLLRISASCGPQGFKSQIRAAGIDIIKVLAWLKQKKEQRHNRRQMKKSMQNLAKDRKQADTSMPNPSEGQVQTAEIMRTSEESQAQDEETAQVSEESQAQAGTTQVSEEGQAQAGGTTQASPEVQIQADAAVKDLAQESVPDSEDTGQLTEEQMQQEQVPKTNPELPVINEESTKKGQSNSKRKKRRQKKKKPFSNQKQKQKKAKKLSGTKNRQKAYDQAGSSESEPGFFKRLRSQIDRVRKEIKDETNRYAVGRVWAELLKMIRSYRPRKLRADLSFSLADPALTGQAVGLVSLLPWIYRYPCRIVPDFTSEQLYLEGEIFAQGKIRVSVFALATLRLLRDKKFMQVVRRLLGREH